MEESNTEDSERENKPKYELWQSFVLAGMIIFGLIFMKVFVYNKRKV